MLQLVSLLFSLFLIPSIAVAQPEVLHTFDATAGEIPENLAIDRKTGDIYVSLLISGKIARLDKEGGNRLDYAMPAGTMLTAGLVFNSHSRRLYVTISSFPSVVGTTGVWELDPDTGVLSLYGAMPDGMFTLLNGITSDEDGNLFVADSLLGYVWKVPSGGGTAVLWADLQAAMGPGEPSPTNPPGPNGLKFSPCGDLYVAISSQSRIVKIELNPDGSAGAVSTFVEGVTPDDFAFDVHGALYLATEPSNSVEKISPDGTRETIASSADGLMNTTAALFGRHGGDRKTLYITNGPPPFPGANPTLMKMNVGVPGFSAADW